MHPNDHLARAMKTYQYGEKEVAARIGANDETVGQWLRGESTPDPQFLQKLCDLFSQTPAELGLPQSGTGSLPHNQACSGSAPVRALLPAPLGMRSVMERAHRNKRVLLAVIVMVVLLLVMGVSGSLMFPEYSTGSSAGSLIFFYHTPYRGIYAASVNSVAWSPNSRYIACATGSGVVYVLDLNRKAEVLAYNGHHDGVNSVIWLPNGRDIASVSRDHTIQVWDAFTGHVIFTATDPAALWAVTVSPDGKFIAWSGRDSIVHVWNLVTGAPVYTYTDQAHSKGVGGLAFSLDGELIASGDSTGTVHVWNTLTGEDMHTYGNHVGRIYDVKWSADSKYIAVASSDGIVQVWDLSHENAVYIYRFHSADVQAVSWAPEGTLLASASADGSVQIWDALTGERILVYQHHSGAVFAMAWSPNGAWIASGDESGALEVWRAA